MAGYNIKLENYKEVREAVSKYPETVKGVLYSEIEILVEDIERGAKKRVPVDTGALRASIRSDYRDGVGEVRADMYYAPYIEFGTGAYVDVPRGLESYAIQFKGRGIRQVNLPARPYFFNTTREEIPKMLKRLVKRLEQA